MSRSLHGAMALLPHQQLDGKVRAPTHFSPGGFSPCGQCQANMSLSAIIACMCPLQFNASPLVFPSAMPALEVSPSQCQQAGSLRPQGAVTGHVLYLEH